MLRQELGCDISLLATDWFLCLFATSLPSESAARVWDALFNEGPKVLYRVSLALLRQHEQLLLSKDNAGGWCMRVVCARGGWGRAAAGWLNVSDSGSWGAGRQQCFVSHHIVTLQLQGRVAIPLA